MQIDASSLTLGQSGSSILGSAASVRQQSTQSAEGSSESSKTSRLFSAGALKETLEARSMGQGGGGVAGPDPDTEGGASLNVYA